MATETLVTFVFELINFAALAALLVWLFFKPIRQVLENERAHSQAEQQAASQHLAEAERLRAELAARRQTLDDELEQLRVSAREAARQDAEAILAAAREQAERERAAFRREEIHLQRAQTSRLARAVAAATHAAVGRLLQQLSGADLQAALCRAACGELANLSDDSLGPVCVESAAPLDEPCRQLIQSALGAAASAAEFRVLPELIAGVRVATARGLIDASAAGLARFAEEALIAEIESMIRQQPGDEP